MVHPAYQDTARALASPTDDRRPAPYRDNDLSLDTSPQRHSSSSDMSSSSRSRLEKLQRTTMSSYRRASDTYRSLSATQQILLVVAGVLSLLVLTLFLRFGESVFAWIAPLADRWREVKGGWCVLWLLTFLVSFPPLIGYSSCVTLAGFVYGVRNGWFIVASATILGSTASFLASRYLLSSFITRMVANDRRFTALALTLKHDGLKLLVMIRLCPLPYSISNGAIATFPTVQWSTFMLASALASPKLLIHVFIGSRLAAIAGDVDRMDPRDKALNWISVLLSLCFGAGTAFFIYRQTKRRANELEAMEREQPGRGGRHDGLADPDDFDDLDRDGEDEEEERMPARQVPQIRVERFHDDSD